jgi:hypothetical protein
MDGNYAELLELDSSLLLDELDSSLLLLDELDSSLLLLDELDSSPLDEDELDSSQGSTDIETDSKSLPMSRA